MNPLYGPLLMLLPVLVLAPGFAASNTLVFDIYLDDSRIGSHKVLVESEGSERRVQVEAQMQVDVLFFTVFSYQHQASERWRDGCIVKLETSTNDDGEKLTVSAAKTPQGVDVKTPSGESRLDGCVRTFAYWDLDLLDSSYLLNTQNGRYEPARLVREDSHPLQFNGRSYGSQRYRLEVGDDVAINLWYDDKQSWQALQTRVAGDRVLRYLRRGEDS